MLAEISAIIAAAVMGVITVYLLLVDILSRRMASDSLYTSLQLNLKSLVVMLCLLYDNSDDDDDDNKLT